MRKALPLLSLLAAMTGTTAAQSPATVTVTIQTDPPGAAVFANLSRTLIGYAPVTLSYQAPSRFYTSQNREDCLRIQPVRVRWSNGTEKDAGLFEICHWSERDIVVTAPKNMPPLPTPRESTPAPAPVDRQAPTPARPETPLSPDQTTSQIINSAKQILASPYHSNPASCHEPWLTRSSLRIVALEPWGKDAGLRLGDRILPIGNMPVTSDWVGAMKALPAGQQFSVAVNRAGQETSVELSCRDHAAYLSAERALWSAIAESRWSDCVYAADRVMQVFGSKLSDVLDRKWQCYILSTNNQSRSDIGAPIVYDFALSMIAEMPFAESVDASDLRRRVVTIIGLFQQAGSSGFAANPTFAADLQERLRAADQIMAAANQPANTSGNTKGAPTSKVSTGSGFAVGPQLIMTALHVVDGTSTVGVKCGGDDLRLATVIAQTSTLATAAAPEFLKRTGSLPQNVNWAVKGTIARSLVETSSSPVRATTRDEAIARATKASCLVVATDDK